ncbi:response regulator transcription factor [Arenibaculum pallidiluteum]|uniref:response regulator transcription factor n=1 Tax=Arenibaculum pallidiluteum TaxID=2812559 RepID=UPI001A95D954|nr:response regulator [Arenibaculum pallidiluteum]
MVRTIILVDDSKLARMVVTGIVGRIQPDWTLIEAANAQEALDLIRENRADIALVDFNMPDIDGLTLIARIRESHPDMPVAVVSANAQDDIIARARALDAAFIEKPLKDETLKPFLSGAALRLKRLGR